MPCCRAPYCPPTLRASSSRGASEKPVEPLISPASPALGRFRGRGSSCTTPVEEANETSAGRTCSQQLIRDGIDQRLETGVDDVGRHADREPALARRLVATLHQHARDRLSATGEDAHLVIDELHVLDVTLIAAQILAQRLVERVNGAIALRHGPERLLIAVDIN